jgi:hypothetical protein
MSKTAYDAFKHSACFDCGYCEERKLPENKAGMLDIRKNGVKIWCYAANDITTIMAAKEKGECPYYAEAEAE